HRLFAAADSPASLLKLSAREIEKLIYPVGFYRTKARNILDICKKLIDDYGGKVPDDIDELLKLKGVGRKTANLVVTLGYKKPGICVDTHVHRISNRWGYVKTKTPEKTEVALRTKLPKPYWIEYNDLLVSFGQHLCRPISPLCSACPVKKYCRRVGVTARR
ncbi:MAG TPA: endonuclease III, partial [Verrucomicrobiae bacterium]|nr:endonuclease III [Verrucomicrobiae bacterium]